MADWVDDFLNQVEADVASGFDPSIAESIRDVFAPIETSEAEWNSAGEENLARITEAAGGTNVVGSITGEEMGPPSYLKEKESDSFFEQLKAEYKKNPTKFWEMGAGAIGNAMQSQDKRKAAETLARSQLDQQNNSDALKQAEVARYNASFGKKGPRKQAPKKPLQRLDGTQIYANGIAKG